MDGIQEEAWVVCSFGFFCCPLSSCCHCHSKDVCLLTQQLLFLFFYSLLLQMCINFNHIIHVPNRCLAWKRQLLIRLKRKCQSVTLDFHSHSRTNGHGLYLLFKFLPSEISLPPGKEYDLDAHLSFGDLTLDIREEGK